MGRLNNLSEALAEMAEKTIRVLRGRHRSFVPLNGLEKHRNLLSESPLLQEVDNGDMEHDVHVARALAHPRPRTYYGRAAVPGGAGRHFLHRDKEAVVHEAMSFEPIRVTLNHAKDLGTLLVGNIQSHRTCFHLSTIVDVALFGPCAFADPHAGFRYPLVHRHDWGVVPHDRLVVCTALQVVDQPKRTKPDAISHHEKLPARQRVHVVEVNRAK
mmetsp:Transcript_48811/g.136634  ORF Transcript_48811/g.136634 Transcript_48811/m.136634 type:complete len:214 (-) Transcript_48811:428-1069(-)